MPADIKAYLNEVRTHLHLDSQTEKRILSEISAHFQDKVNELEEEGFTRAAAEREAVSAFGEARSIARLMYEACSRGSWVDAFMSFQPHAIAAALFATHYWNNPYVLGAALAFITVITVMGWRSGAPAWMYSWAGYAFFPLLIMAFVFRHPMAGTLGYLLTGTGIPVSIWALAGLIAYYAGVSWLLLWAVVQVAKRDWLFVSLMLLPLPALGFWALTMEQNGIRAFAAMREIGPVFSSWDGAMAFFCFALGVTSTLFIRMRRRFYKACAILGIGIIAGALALRSIRGNVDLISMLTTSAFLLAILMSPLLLHAFIGHEITEKDGQP